MDIRQLRVFTEIVRQGNFTRAAEQLHIAQPAVSMTLRKLEEELDLTLLNRQDKRITLTAEGETLLKHAERILDNLTVATTEMAELKELSRGEVRIGIPPMMSSFYFPKIIQLFRRQYPHLQVAVSGEGAGQIQRLLRKGEIDMGVITAPRPHGELSYQHFLREEIVACVPVGHPLAGRVEITPAEFFEEPQIVFKKGYYMRELLDEMMAGEKQSPQIIFETNLYTLVSSLIKQGLGTSTFLRMAVQGDPQLAAISFSPRLHLDLYIAWKSDRYLSRANRAFIDFLLRENRLSSTAASDKDAHHSG